MKYLIGIVIAYVLAAPLTPTISLDLRETEWLNAWTYIVWAFSGVIWVGIASLAVFVGAFILTFLER